MRFAKLVFLASVFSSCNTTYATATDVYFETPETMLLNAEKTLENRLIFCRSIKTSGGHYYDFWLQSQSFEVRRKALWDLGLMAGERCYGKQRNAWSDALFRYVAITGDRVRLERWVATYFDKPFPRAVTMTQPMAEYKKQLERLSQQPVFMLPFDVVLAAEAIAPLPEWRVDSIARLAYNPYPNFTGLYIEGVHIQ